LLLFQIITLGYITTLKSDNSKNNLSTLINAVENKRYIEPIRSVSESKVYFPEARISVPLNDISRKVRYDMFTTQDGTVKNIYLSLPGVIGNQIDKDVATCDKMVRISASNTPSKDEKSVGEIEPTSSGLRYIFKHNQCEIYSSGLSDRLVDVAKSIQSY